VLCLMFADASADVFFAAAFCCSDFMMAVFT